jgi:HEAT repeat protein
MTGLASNEDQLALGAVERLGEGGVGVGAVAELLALLAHHSWTVRRAVVTSLSRGDQQTLAELCRLLVEARTNEPIIAGLVDALSAAPAAAVPLVRELLSHENPAILCDAIQILGRRQDAASTRHLVELTAHADDNVALSAIEALGRIGGDAAVDRLIELAEGDNFFRIFPAIELLGRSREARALPSLQRLLKQPLYATEAARAIGRIGSLTGVAALVKAMETGPEATLRVGALGLVAIHDYAVHNVGPAAAVSRTVREHAGRALRDKIARAMSFSDDAETVALGRVLIWLANEDSVSDFVRLLNGPEEVSRLAIEGLSELSALGDARVLAALHGGTSELRARLLPVLMGVAAASEATVACLSDEQAAVRALACHALARGREVAVVPRLFALLTDADLGVVHAALGAIQSLGSAETEALALTAFTSAKPSERRAALRIITYFGYDASLRLCVEALGSDDEKLRDIAVGGLPALDDASVPTVLAGAARHASGRTRASAIRALGHVPLSANTEATLRAALDDPDAWVRYYACQSLGKLGVAAALPAISARLQDPAGQVKMAAVEALAALPGDAARRALADAAGSTDLDVQRAAVVGAGERAEPELRPVLQAALRSPDASIRLVAVSSIARFADAEAELSAAAGDEDAAVRGAALGLLATRSGSAATSTLIALLTQQPDSAGLVSALSQDVDLRIPVILAELERANDALARALLAVLARSRSPQGRAALDVAFASGNLAVRRASARVLSLLLDDSAKSSLARAAHADGDAEVRRISAAALA